MHYLPLAATQEEPTPWTNGLLPGLLEPTLARHEEVTKNALLMCQQRRSVWSRLVQAEANKARLVADLRLHEPDETRRTAAAKIRNLLTARQTRSDALRQRQRDARERYGRELQAQIDSHETLAAENVDLFAQETPQLLLGSPRPTSARPELVPEAETQLEAEYSQKIKEAELRIDRVRWQQRRLDIQDRRIKNYRLIERLQAEDSVGVEVESAPTTGRHIAPVMHDSNGENERNGANFITVSNSGPAASLLSDRPDTVATVTAPDTAALSVETGPSSLELTPSSQLSSTAELGSIAATELLPPEPLVETAENEDPDSSSSLGAPPQRSSLLVPEKRGHTTGPIPLPERKTESRAVAGSSNIELLAALPTENNLKIAALRWLRLNPEGEIGTGASFFSSDELVLSLSSIVRFCIEDTIIEQDRLAQTAVIDTFLHPGMLDFHGILRTIKDRFLLGNGDFASALARNMEDRPRISGVGQHQCRMMLDDAFGAAGTPDTMAEQFSLSVRNLAKPPTFILAYKPTMTWPTTMILTESTMGRYNQIFAMLMQVQNTLVTAKELFSILKSMKRRDSIRPDPYQANLALHIFRHDMHQYICGLQDFLMTDIHILQWKKLQDNIKVATSICDIRDAHSQYVDSVAEICLLFDGFSAAAKIVAAMSNLISTFRTQLLAHKECLTRPDDFEIQRSYQDALHTGELFRKHREFLLKVLHKEAQSAQKEHGSMRLSRYLSNFER